MKIRDIILEQDESLAAQVRDELASKVGNPPLPQFISLPQDAVLARSMNYAVRPNFTIELAVDQAIREIQQERKDKLNRDNAPKPKEKTPKPDRPLMDPDKAAARDRTRVDSRGRKLKHQRYYNTKTAKSKVSQAVQKRVTTPYARGAEWADKFL